MTFYSLIPNWVPPVFALLRISRLWLPLPVVVLWPLLLVVWVVLGVVLLMLPRQPRLPRRRDRFRAWWLLWCALGALRGLHIDVRAAARPTASTELQQASAQREATPAQPRSSAPAPHLEAAQAEGEQRITSRAAPRRTMPAQQSRPRPARIYVWVL